MEPTEGGELTHVPDEDGEVEPDEEKEQLISTWDKIVKHREKIRGLVNDEVVAKKEHAAVKAALDKAWDQLGQLIDDEKKCYEPNLFNTPVQKEDDSWRRVFIGDIGLPSSISEKLIGADINDMGKLSDWSNSGKLLSDIPGIGTQTAEKIQDALTAFWENRNRQDAAAKAAAAVEKTAAEQKARKAPLNELTLKADADAKIIAAGLAAMGMGQSPTVATGNDTPTPGQIGGG